MRSSKLSKRPKADWPLAYRQKESYFIDLKLRIEPGIFIPRPETEELVELALHFIPLGAISILDLGTGSGAIALAVASQRPKASVTGTDISPQAIGLARFNQKHLGLTNLSFTESNLFQNLNNQKFDYLIANLPYLPYDERHLHPSTQYEPREALFAPRYGTFFIHQTLSRLSHYIKRMAFFEIDPCTVLILKNDLQRLNLQGEFKKDLSNKTRFLVVSVKSAPGHRPGR